MSGEKADQEWKAAMALRKALEDTFYLLELAGQHGDKNDALKAEAMLRRAAMYFDAEVPRESWDK